jgi:hypothetical protein
MAPRHALDTEALMAIDFVKNASNYLSYAAGSFNGVLSGASKISVSAWVNIDTLDLIAFGNVVVQANISGGNAGLKLSIDGATGQSKVRLQARSGATDAAQTRTGSVDVGTATWVQVGGTVDIGADSIATVSNGSIEGSTSVTFGQTTYTPGTATDSDRVGAGNLVPVETNQQMDGRIGPVSVWTFTATQDALVAGEWAALGDGFDPLLVRPQNLIFYEPFTVVRTTPSDYISKLTATITGTLSYAPGTRVFAPKKKRYWFRPPTTYSQSLSATAKRSAIIRRSTFLTRSDAVVRRVTLRRQASKLFSDTVVRTASLARQLVFTKLLSTTVRRAATLTRRITLNMVFSTTVVRTVNLTRTLVTNLLFSVTVVRTISLARAKSMSFAVTVVRAASVALGAILIPYRNKTVPGHAGFMTRAKTRWKARGKPKKKNMRI